MTEDDTFAKLCKADFHTVKNAMESILNFDNLFLNKHDLDKLTEDRILCAQKFGWTRLAYQTERMRRFLSGEL
jgi:hypothetical protein